MAERALELHPDLPIVARAHSDEEVTHLRRMGAREVVMGEREIAARMADHATDLRAERLADEARQDG